MRSVLAASLLLSPMLYAASATAMPPKTDAPATPKVSQISYDTTTPAVIDAASFRLPGASLSGMFSNQEKVVLAVKVDEKGNPNVVRILQSANPELDARVVAAVSRSSFHPATLGNHAVPVELNLVVAVQR